MIFCGKQGEGDGEICWTSFRFLDGDKGGWFRYAFWSLRVMGDGFVGK